MAPCRCGRCQGTTPSPWACPGAGVGCRSSFYLWPVCLHPRLPLKRLVGAGGCWPILGYGGLLSAPGLGWHSLLLLCVPWAGRLPEGKQCRWGSLSSDPPGQHRMQPQLRPSAPPQALEHPRLHGPRGQLFLCVWVGMVVHMSSSFLLCRCPLNDVPSTDDTWALTCWHQVLLWEVITVWVRSKVLFNTRTAVMGELR